MCQCLSINQNTKHAEFPQTYVDKVVDTPVEMARQVPWIQTVLKTRKVPQSSQSGTGSAPVSILFGHFGGDASAGLRSAKEWWRMAHPSSSDGDDGSRQRAWTKSLKALRHFAADRVADEKLMERAS